VNIEEAVRRLAASITPNVVGSQDATGSHVESLTEAVMGITAGLVQIANAIDRVADTMERTEELTAEVVDRAKSAREVRP
jgi:hypothetical protein